MSLEDLKGALTPVPKPQTRLTGDAAWDAIEKIAKSLNKKYDTTTSVIRMGAKVFEKQPSISTGLPSFDLNVMQCGGIPFGRFIELYGPPSSGKTSLALHITACAQQQGYLAAYIDAEHALEIGHAKSMGVNTDDLLIAQPDSGEQVLETVESLVESNAVGLIVVDSIAAIVPQAELDGEMGDSHMGLQARLMSQACRKLRGKCRTHNVAVLWINQLRSKIGVMYGSPEVTTGGIAMTFYASVRLDVRRRKVFGPEDAPEGHEMEVTAIKNKVGAPKRKTQLHLVYGHGFDKDADVFTYAKLLGVIEQSGAWFSFNGTNIGQGKEATIVELQSNPKLKSEVLAAIKERE